MGLWSWLFPTDADLLARARSLMAAGRFEKARSVLMGCKLPEAEELYDECSAAIDKADLPNQKKRLKDQGFHGWKIEVATKSPKLKRDLEAMVAEELASAGVDLGLPDIDQKVFDQCVKRAEKRARKGGATEVGRVQLVPMMDKQLREQLLRAQEQEDARAALDGAGASGDARRR